ncbi:MAG TPA: aminotransferase class V-fold PLP-dependent enzyme [Thermoanaerobaculia bacterium]
MISKILLRREQFPVTDHLVYLNHAAVGPLSAAACAAMERHAREQRDWGALNWRDWIGEYVEFREEAAALIGAEPSEISVLKNTSEGISFVANGFRWKEGENAVTTDLEFPSNSVPWRRLASRGVECRIVKSRDGAYTVEDVERLIDANTRILSVSSVCFHNGFRPDLAALGALCRAKGVLFCVDAIQSLGALPMDVGSAGIHFLAADGHKWLMGPEGTAIFFCAAEVRDRLDVLESGWLNVKRGEEMLGVGTELRHDGRRFEAGSLNTNGIYGLRAAIALLRHVGIENIEHELIWVASALAAMLESCGFELRTPRPIASGIVSFSVPQDVDIARLKRISAAPDGLDDPVILMHRWLELNDVICAPREGMLRFAPHFYNDEEDIERVKEVLAVALR